MTEYGRTKMRNQRPGAMKQTCNSFLNFSCPVENLHLVKSAFPRPVALIEAKMLGWITGRDCIIYGKCCWPWWWSCWRTEGCPVSPPWPPPRANMSKVWTGGIPCVQICPPTHPPTAAPPSSFFQTICTKDPDKGAQSDARMSPRASSKLSVQQKNAFLHSTEMFPLSGFSPE